MEYPALVVLRPYNSREPRPDGSRRARASHARRMRPLPVASARATISGRSVRALDAPRRRALRRVVAASAAAAAKRARRSQPSVDPPPARAGAAAPSPSSPSADHLSKTALGSCALLAMCAVVEPASARDVTVSLPDLPDFGEVSTSLRVALDGLSNLEVPSTRMEFLRLVLSNPIAAVAVSVSAYLVIPKASELLVKFVLAPAIVLVVAAAAAQHPAETSAVAAAAIREVRDNPTITSGVILALCVVFLSPYFLVAGFAAIIVSGVNVLPDALKPALPRPLRDATNQIAALQRAADPSVKRVQGFSDEAYRRSMEVKSEMERLAAEEAERDRAEAIRRRAETVASGVTSAITAPAREAERRVRDAAEIAADAASDAADVVRDVNAEATSVTRCVDKPTAASRAACVDENRAERTAREAKRTEALRAKARRLRANSAKATPPIPPPPDVLGALTRTTEK